MTVSTAIDALSRMNPVERATALIDRYFPAGIGVYADGRIELGRGEAIPMIDAATGTTIGSWRDPGTDGADLALTAAARAMSVWGGTPPFDRARILRSVSNAIQDRAEELATLETVSTGKPLRDTRAEANRVAEMFSYYAGWADKVFGMAIPVPGDWLAYTRRVPCGVVVAITPWNAPMFTAAWNSAPALATGNAVVLKPSEFTPFSSLRLAQIAELAGLPPGVWSVAPGLGATVGAALVTDPRVRKVSFVGSVPTGRRVAASAALAGIPSLLELGGKSANIVFADANIEAAAYGAVSAIFSGAGQSCVAGSRLLVERSIHDDLMERVLRAADRLQIGDPLDPTTEVGPIISPVQLSRIRDLVDLSVREGARLHASYTNRSHLTSGILGDGQWVVPTVLDGVTSDHTIETTEVFGPVLATGTFDDEAEAVRRANGTPFGLAGAVWTRDVARAHRVAEQVKAGTFWINSYKTIHVAVPFGGLGASGWGRSSGPGVLDEYTETKAVWVPTRAVDPAFPSLAY